MTTIARMATQLVPLKDVERLSSSVIRILGGNPGKVSYALIQISWLISSEVHTSRYKALMTRLKLSDNFQGTNTYLVGTGRRRILIDTGEGKPAWISAVQKVLKDEDATVSDTILTHWHHDHVSGQKHLLEVSPETKIYKNTPDEGQLNIENGQRFQVDGATLRALFSPGHAQDHMALVLEEEDAMFTGDNVLGHGTAVFEDLAMYLDSLDKMRAVFRGRAYPGHGAVIDDGPSKILEYIHHRKQREDQVIQILKSSKSSPGVAVSGGEPDAWTSMEIVKIVYKEVPENLHIPANGGIVQILLKLEGEDKVFEDSATGSWRIKDRAAL